jgi:hypothetical protein
MYFGRKEVNLFARLVAAVVRKGAMNCNQWAVFADKDRNRGSTNRGWWLVSKRHRESIGSPMTGAVFTILRRRHSQFSDDGENLADHFSVAAIPKLLLQI